MSHHHAHATTHPGPGAAPALAHDVVLLGERAAALPLPSREVTLRSPATRLSALHGGLRLTLPDGSVEHARAVVVDPAVMANGMHPNAGLPRVWTLSEGTAAAVEEKLASEDAIQNSGPWPDVAEEGYWEERYAGTVPRWSGRPNASLVAAVGSLRIPDGGTAADVGCGEGADALWLAEQGWVTLGVDVSGTAVQRARAAASAAGLGADRVSFTASGALGVDGPFELVTASYLHSPAQAARDSLLARAAGWVPQGGHLFVLSHVMEDPAPAGPATDQEIGELGLDPTLWSAVGADTVSRPGILPTGEVIDRPDRWLLLRRA